MNYSLPNKKFTSEFFNLTGKAKSIGIIGHRSPDEDSIASILAIYSLLTDKYPRKKIKSLQIGETIDKYKIFKHFDKIIFVSDIVGHLKEIDLLIMIDGSGYHRFTYQPEKLKAFPGKTICLDHHSSPPEDFDLALIAPKISSSAEIIYQSFYQKAKIDQSLAEILILGIFGDTGNFAYLKSYQTKTLTIAKRLMEAGKIEIQEFQSRYRTISKRIFMIIQELIRNTSFHRIKGWPDFQTSFIDRNFARKANYSDNEISEAGHLYMIHYLRLIGDYTWGFIVTPESNGDCSVSLRSLPKSVNVRNIMERTDLGGGHDRAAGGNYPVENKKPRVVLNCFNNMLGWIKRNKPVIV